MQGELDMPRFNFVSTSSLIPEAGYLSKSLHFSKASITSVPLYF